RRRISLCADCILRPDSFPLDTAPELWPRVWQWIEFLQLYYDCGPPLETDQVVADHLMYTQIIVPLSRHEPTSVVIFTTKGVRRILAVCWATAVHNKYDAEKPATLLLTMLPLSGLHQTIKEPEHLEEVVDACGGSLTALARTLAKNIYQVARHAELSRAVTAILSLFTLLGHTTRVSPAFWTCLLSHGIVPALVSALEIEGISSTGGEPTDIEFGLNVLIGVFNRPPGYPWIVQALRAGLLRRVVASGERFATVAEAGGYADLLANVLPQALVSNTVVEQMRKVFVELDPLARSTAFSRSALYEHWGNLKVLVDERAEVLDAWEASGRASYLACYDTTCDTIDTKNLFRRCSACGTASYCSRSCQRRDWKAGHRDECNILRHAASAYADLGLHYHEKGFIRALLDAEYQCQRLPISVQKLDFMAEHPNTPFFVMFDFTVSPVEPYVIHAIPVGSAGLDATPHLGRLARSGERLTIHLVHLGHGSRRSYSIFPLRATSSRFHDGLVELARELDVPRCAPQEVIVRVQQLIEATDKDTSYRKIH
ncbi:hypothetical protein C8R46DRAFT_1104458, partial [Mycena filopes]